jgi:hypothetical protein
MPMPRAPRALVRTPALLAVAVVRGCIGSRLSPDAPPGQGPQGVWKLDRAASDDPQKIIDTLRAEAEKKIHRAMNAPPPPVTGGSGGGPRRRGRQGQQGGVDSGEPPPEDFVPPQQGPGMDPLRNSPTMHSLREVLQRGDYLTIRQSPEQMSFDYGTTVRSYTPGGRSVVSSENGVADQTSGWHGKQYVINIKPQLGPAIVEEYGLSPDGKHLIVKTRIGPFELSRVNLTRVYDPASAAVPNSGPSNE